MSYSATFKYLCDPDEKAPKVINKRSVMVMGMIDPDSNFFEGGLEIFRFSHTYLKNHSSEFIHNDDLRKMCEELISVYRIFLEMVTDNYDYFSPKGFDDTTIYDCYPTEYGYTLGHMRDYIKLLILYAKSGYSLELSY